VNAGGACGQVDGGEIDDGKQGRCLIQIYNDERKESQENKKRVLEDDKIKEFIARCASLEYVHSFRTTSSAPLDYVHTHHQNAVGTKWEFEGTGKRSNAGVGSLRKGSHRIVRGDRAVTR